MTKEEARSLMRKMRAELSGQQRRIKDKSIFDRLFADPVWQEIEWFYPYVSYGTEVDTISMIRHVLNGKAGQGIRVAVPKVCGREMDFYEITGMKQLQPGYHGILEPVAECPKVSAQEGLMLLPGLAFDKENHRVGYGGGYYDRYLAACGGKKPHLYAAAYDFQIVDRIEAQRHDIAVHKIIVSQNKHN